MKTLQAFLFTCTQSNDWSYRIFDEYSSLLDAANVAIQSVGTGAAIHVGFTRPNTEIIASLTSRFPNQILLSDAARLAFPEALSVSSQPVGNVEGIEFRVLTCAPSSPNNQVSKRSNQHPKNWVQTLIEQQSDYSESLSSCKVVDEESYVQHEASIERKFRQQLAHERFSIMTGELPAAGNLLEHLNALPPWVFNANLNSLDLTVRQKNVFGAHSFKTVADVHRYSLTKNLLQLPNIGKTSLVAFGQILLDAFTHFPDRLMDEYDRSMTGDPKAEIEKVASRTVPSVEKINAPLEISPKDLEECFVEAARPLSERERSVWAALMGYRCQPRTLQAVAEAPDIVLTRERVRQLEISIYKKVAQTGAFTILESKLDEIFKTISHPLSLTHLETQDAWFQQATELKNPLKSVFHRLFDDRFSIILIGDSPVISRIKARDWNHGIEAGKAMLESLSDDSISESIVKSQILALLPTQASELTEPFWREINKLAYWDTVQDGERRLIGYGKSVEVLVRAVLRASSIPLHYEEIHRRANNLKGEAVDLRRIHSAAASIGLLYARGTYGLASHFPLPNDECQHIVDEVDDIFSTHDLNKQWHTNEIIEALLSREISASSTYNKYLIDLVLKRSDQFASFGRMVWGVKNCWTEASAAQRLDLRQSIQAILETAGKPLTTKQIKEKLTQERGINEHFQIYAGDNLVRLGSSLWGLLSRDVMLTNIDEHLGALRRYLETTHKGIHASEISDALKITNPSVVTTMVNMCERANIKRDRSQYLYLAEWGESRRCTLLDAARSVVLNIPPEGSVFNVVYEKIVALMQREVPRNSVSGILQALEFAHLDPRSNRWHHDASASDKESEEDVSH